MSESRGGDDNRVLIANCGLCDTRLRRFLRVGRAGWCGDWTLRGNGGVSVGCDAKGGGGVCGLRTAMERRPYRAERLLLVCFGLVADAADVASDPDCRRLPRVTRNWRFTGDPVARATTEIVRAC